MQSNGTAFVRIVPRECDWCEKAKSNVGLYQWKHSGITYLEYRACLDCAPKKIGTGRSGRAAVEEHRAVAATLGRPICTSAP